MDTPSGPAGRRARWHETLSKFDIKVVYTPGKDHLVADALSRWAYPASKALADISKHCNRESTEEAQEKIREEIQEEQEISRSTFVVGNGTLDRIKVDRTGLGRTAVIYSHPEISGCFGVGTRGHPSGLSSHSFDLRHSCTPPGGIFACGSFVSNWTRGSNEWTYVTSSLAANWAWDSTSSEGFNQFLHKWS